MHRISLLPWEGSAFTIFDISWPYSVWSIIATNLEARPLLLYITVHKLKNIAIHINKFTAISLWRCLQTYKLTKIWKWLQNSEIKTIIYLSYLWSQQQQTFHWMRKSDIRTWQTFNLMVNSKMLCKMFYYLLKIATYHCIVSTTKNYMNRYSKSKSELLLKTASHY